MYLKLRQNLLQYLQSHVLQKRLNLKRLSLKRLSLKQLLQPLIQKLHSLGNDKQMIRSLLLGLNLNQELGLKAEDVEQKTRVIRRPNEQQQELLTSTQFRQMKWKLHKSLASAS